MPDPWVIGYSQFGEHLDIHEAVGNMDHGYAADVGAGDGLSLSNTKQLEDRGWDVLCVEPSPVFQADLKRRRKRVAECAAGKENLENQDFYVYEVIPGNFEAISSLRPEKDRPFHAECKPKFIAKVPVRKLDTLLEEAGFPRLDVLSIDVEGTENDVLDGLTLSKWRPKIIVIEDWRGGQFRERLGNEGYALKHRRAVNEIFIRVG